MALGWIISEWARIPRQCNYELSYGAWLHMLCFFLPRVLRVPWSKDKFSLQVSLLWIMFGMQKCLWFYITNTFINNNLYMWLVLMYTYWHHSSPQRWFELKTMGIGLCRAAGWQINNCCGQQIYNFLPQKNLLLMWLVILQVIAVNESRSSLGSTQPFFEVDFRRSALNLDVSKLWYVLISQ